jgi:ACS family hexuronate transporter-like MFS transporter
MAIAKLTGWVLDWTGSYLSLFILAAAVYPVALALMHGLNPRMERMVITPRSP